MAAVAAVIIAVAMLLPMTPGMVAPASPTPLRSMPSGAIRSDAPRSDLAVDPPADVRGEATFSPRPALNLYYQWVGVATDPMTGGWVQGIGSTVDVRPASVPCAATGFANFDRSSLEISVTSSVYANVGFFLLNSSIGSSACSTSGPYPYYRDASGNFQVVCSGGTLADGPHSFNATAVDGSDVWAFTVDGAAIRGVTYNWTTGQCDGPSVDGQVNLANATATLPSLWSAMKEETTDPNQSF